MSGKIGKAARGAASATGRLSGGKRGGRKAKLTARFSPVSFR
jgi:hypothetical protein